MAPSRAPAQRSASLPLVLLFAVTIAIWLALGRLAWAFVAEQLDWRYVAEQSRVEAPLPYRLAGVWGGHGGIAAAVRRDPRRRRDDRRSTAPRRRLDGRALATVLTVTAVDLALASPFGRLDVPAVRGFGMNPILEHPAMTIHPPLLYAGLAAALGAAVVAAGAPAPWRSARPWLLATIGALTAAMTLGAAWSYLEQGWGGYWAWDPVENTSLLVWLAALAAVHGGPLASPRVAVVLAAAPWLLATIGSVLVRSGATPSIHGFAEQRAVGWALAGLAVATTVGHRALAVARTTSPAVTGHRAPRPAAADGRAAWRRPPSSCSPGRSCRCSRISPAIGRARFAASSTAARSVRWRSSPSRSSPPACVAGTGGARSPTPARSCCSSASPRRRSTA